MNSPSPSSSTSTLHTQHSQLLQAFNSPSPNLPSIGHQLTKLKILLTQTGLLIPSLEKDKRKTPQELILARDVLETGAFWSIRVKDVKSFERYMDLLKVFYTDLSSLLPTSSNQPPLLGLSLLRLLSSNSIASFHTTLETLPSHLLQSSPYLQHPINLERWLMEGSYSKVWRSRDEVPREEYRFFVDGLMETIRGEIAACEERAYDSLPLGDAATLLFFDSRQDIAAFANERGWQINPSTQTVHFNNKTFSSSSSLSTTTTNTATTTTTTRGVEGSRLEEEEDREDRIPKRAMIASNLSFARELESIV